MLASSLLESHLSKYFIYAPGPGPAKNSDPVGSWSYPHSISDNFPISSHRFHSGHVAQFLYSRLCYPFSNKA